MKDYLTDFYETYDEEGRLHAFFFQRIENAVGDDGARSVVEGEIDAFFLCRFRERKGGRARREPRAEVRREYEQHRKEQEKGNVLFLHIFSMGKFYKNIYFFFRSCYNTVSNVKMFRHRAEEGKA